MRIIHLERRHLASRTPLLKRPGRHGNTTIAPPPLSQNLRRGDGNDGDGNDDDGTGGEKEVKTSRSFGIFRSFRLSISRREDKEVICIERRKRSNFELAFFKLLVFHMSRREEEGILCITAEIMKGKYGHSAFMRRQCKTIYDIVS